MNACASRIAATLKLLGAMSALKDGLDTLVALVDRFPVGILHNTADMESLVAAMAVHAVVVIAATLGSATIRCDLW